MKHQSVVCCVALASLPLAVHAQPATDPSAPVPAVPYRSVFKDTPRGVETETLDWTAANRQVGQFLRGHIDILKWEAAQPKSPPAAPASSTETAKP